MEKHSEVAPPTLTILGAGIRRTLHRGPCAGESPDLVVAFSAGYRVSWRTALWGFERSIVEDNSRRWGGDHIVSPTRVPGVCFANRAIASRSLCMMDLARTVLAALGISVPRAMEGRSIAL